MNIVRLGLFFVVFGLCLANSSATLLDAQRLYEQGRNAEALAEIESLLVKQPDDAELRFLRGIIYAERGESDRAIEVFAQLTQDFPELPEPWNNLAVLFAERGEFDKSREALLAAIQTHPSYSTAHENLGDLYARMAGMAYDQALEQDRANDSARLKLSAVNGLFSVPRSTTTENPIVVAAVDPKPTAVEPKPAVARPKPTVVEPKPAVVEPKPVVVQPKPAVVEPKPAVVEPKPVQVADERQAIESAVRTWASAWSNKNVQGYLASYSRSFKPSNGASYGAWARYREERLTKPKVIEVDLSNMRVNQTGSNDASVEFRQKYRSDNYRDEVTKALTMKKSNGAWLIIAEESR